MIILNSSTLRTLKKYLFFSLIMLMNNLTVQSQEKQIPQLFKGEASLHQQYGITSHITWTGFEYDRYKENIDFIRQGGHNIIRTSFGARLICWGKENVSFKALDDVSSEASRNGLQMLPIIYPNDNNETEQNRANNREYVRECVTRYGNNVAGWEIGNELDLENAANGSYPPHDYLLTLKDCYLSVKETNPSNLVLLGAIGDIKNNYLDRLLSAHASDYFDVLSVHYYAAHGIPENIISYANSLDTLLRKYNYQKPIWLTETGYSSDVGEAVQENFYTEIMPKVYRKLGINISKKTMGLLHDDRINRNSRNQDNNEIFHGFKACRQIGLDDLKTLSVKEIPVLMVLFREYFPKGYFDDLKSYIARGGTVVFPEGGAAMFNELDVATNKITAVGKKYYAPLHINIVFPWESESKTKGVKKIKKITTASEIGVKYSWKEEDLSSPMYLTGENIKTGDEFIPIVYGEDSLNKIVVAAYYKLNSELRGNIIIQTRPNHSIKVSRQLQGSRSPRLYLLAYSLGFDKVLVYCLRERMNGYKYGLIGENDELKPAYLTLTTLFRFLPSGSSRPVLREDNGVYVATWITDAGEKTYGVWSSNVGKNIKVKVKGKAKFFDEMGNRLGRRKVQITPCVTYITGATSLELVENN